VQHYDDAVRVGRVMRDATRMLATFRLSRHVKMVWRVADMSATSRACRARGHDTTDGQTDEKDKEL